MYNSVHLWSDSSDVLCWLKDRPSEWPVFVANRCSEILTLMPGAFWHQVRSRENPADIASRGIEPSKLQSDTLWWQGPEWLVENPIPWSTSDGIAAANNPVNSFSLVSSYDYSLSSNLASSAFASLQLSSSSLNTPLWDLVEKNSSATKVFRITAYCLRFLVKLINKLKLRRLNAVNTCNLDLEFCDFSSTPSELALSLKELTNARLLWVHYYQRTHLSEEMKSLISHKPIRSSSSLLRLSPILVKGLMRVGGRLRNSSLDADAKHPLILPAKNRFVQLLVEHAHQITLHGRTQLTLITVRKQYWILKGRQEVKSVIHKCTSCIRYSARAGSQMMSDLPSARVLPCSPFQRAGIDYAGLFSVRS